jgi:hypothetical protein
MASIAFTLPLLKSRQHLYIKASSLTIACLVVIETGNRRGIFPRRVKGNESCCFTVQASSKSETLSSIYGKRPEILPLLLLDVDRILIYESNILTVKIEYLRSIYIIYFTRNRPTSDITCYP